MTVALMLSAPTRMDITLVLVIKVSGHYRSYFNVYMQHAVVYAPLFR